MIFLFLYMYIQTYTHVYVFIYMDIISSRLVIIIIMISLLVTWLIDEKEICFVSMDNFKKILIVFRFIEKFYSNFFLKKSLCAYYFSKQ